MVKRYYRGQKNNSISKQNIGQDLGKCNMFSVAYMSIK